MFSAISHHVSVRAEGFVCAISKVIHSAGPEAELFEASDLTARAVWGFCVQCGVSVCSVGFLCPVFSAKAAVKSRDTADTHPGFIPHFMSI